MCEKLCVSETAAHTETGLRKDMFLIIFNVVFINNNIVFSSD